MSSCARITLPVQRALLQARAIVFAAAATTLLAPSALGNVNDQDLRLDLGLDRGALAGGEGGPAQSMSHSVSRWEGSSQQCDDVLTKLKARGVFLGKGFRKCAFALPDEGLVVKIVHCCCPERAEYCNRQSPEPKSPKNMFQNGLADEVASLIVDPLRKPKLEFYCGANATRVTKEAYFKAVALSGGTDESNNESTQHNKGSCSHLLGLSNDFLLAHVPFVVLRKVQTKPRCISKERASQNFATMEDAFRRYTRPMLVDIDHELAMLSSDCVYTFVDFDSTCYNHATNTSIPSLEYPFKRLTGEERTSFRSCSESLTTAGSTQVLHRHVLSQWAKMRRHMEEGRYPSLVIKN